jgi:integrase/recombinase XerD
MTSRMPIAEWPALDRALWEKGVEPKGLFEIGGVGADWAHHSRCKTAGGYSHWLSWLATQRPFEPGVHPADRVTSERVAAYVEYLRAERAPYTVLCRVQELYDALRIMAPDADWDWLIQVYRSLRAQVRPVRDKLSRLKPIDELAAVGERLMDEAETAVGWSARRRAVGYRDGLMIALLAYRPVRLKNFASMRLGRHLTKVGGCWQILFAADETKSHVPYEAIAPSPRGSSAISTSIDPSSYAGNALAAQPREGRPPNGRRRRQSIPGSMRSGFRKSEPSSCRK